MVERALETICENGTVIVCSTESADEIAGIAKQKWAEYDAKIKQLGESILPEAEYAGVPKQLGICELENANVYKANGVGDMNINPGSSL